MSQFRPERDPERPVYVISVAATLVSAHPRTLRIYEDEGLLCPARTPTNIRLYSENDIRRLTWIRHLTRDRGVNLAGIKLLFELEERLGARILEALYAEATDDKSSSDGPAADHLADGTTDDVATTKTSTSTSTAAATATANPNLGDT
jgi:MerR family transcriptional regulator/heat shock protein HspR